MVKSGTDRRKLEGGEVVVARPVPPGVQAAFEARVSRLEARLQGVMGVCARHLETGEGFEVNGGVRFPMASTYKIPIAGAVLSRIDRGELALEQMVPITQRDLDETGPVAQSVRHAGVSLSLANLIELMLAQSNNNATDRLFALAGGPAKVTEWVRSTGVEAMRVDTLVNDLLNKFFGFEPGSAAHKTLLAKFPTPEQQLAVEAALKPTFDDDPADTTTPRAMADLLVGLFAGRLLSETSREFLIEVMQRCETGPGRLKGMLPPGTVVARKTGTVGGTINDAGMMTLPDGRGRLVIAVYTKKSALMPQSLREPLIAEIGRSAFDYFSIR